MSKYADTTKLAVDIGNSASVPIAPEGLASLAMGGGDEELSRYLKFMQANTKQAGNESGLKISLLAIYLSTEAVYRMELGRGEPDEFGRRMLSPQEVALAIAYASGDSPPADTPILRDALRNDLLTNKKNSEDVVRKMIAKGAVSRIDGVT